MQDLDACCDIPQLVSDTIFDKCMEEAGDGPGGPPNGRPKRGHHHKRVHVCVMLYIILNNYTYIISTYR